MKYQNIVIGLMLIVGIVLFVTRKNKEIVIGHYLALLLIIALSFAFPLLALVLAIPISIIVVTDNQTKIAAFWNQVSKYKIS